MNSPDSPDSHSTTVETPPDSSSVDKRALEAAVAGAATLIVGGLLLGKKGGLLAGLIGAGARYFASRQAAATKSPEAPAEPAAPTAESAPESSAAATAAPEVDAPFLAEAPETHFQPFEDPFLAPAAEPESFITEPSAEAESFAPFLEWQEPEAGTPGEFAEIFKEFSPAKPVREPDGEPISIALQESAPPVEKQLYAAAGSGFTLWTTSPAPAVTEEIAAPDTFLEEPFLVEPVTAEPAAADVGEVQSLSVEDLGGFFAADAPAPEASFTEWAPEPAASMDAGEPFGSPFLIVPDESKPSGSESVSPRADSNLGGAAAVSDHSQWEQNTAFGSLAAVPVSPKEVKVEAAAQPAAPSFVDWPQDLLNESTADASPPEMVDPRPFLIIPDDADEPEPAAASLSGEVPQAAPSSAPEPALPPPASARPIEPDAQAAALAALFSAAHPPRPGASPVADSLPGDFLLTPQKPRVESTPFWTDEPPAPAPPSSQSSAIAPEPGMTPEEIWKLAADEPPPAMLEKATVQELAPEPAPPPSVSEPAKPAGAPFPAAPQVVPEEPASIPTVMLRPARNIFDPVSAPGEKSVFEPVRPGPRADEALKSAVVQSESEAAPVASAARPAPAQPALSPFNELVALPARRSTLIPEPVGVAGAQEAPVRKIAPLDLSPRRRRRTRRRGAGLIWFLLFLVALGLAGYVYRVPLEKWFRESVLLQKQSDGGPASNRKDHVSTPRENPAPEAATGGPSTAPNPKDAGNAPGPTGAPANPLPPPPPPPTEKAASTPQPDAPSANQPGADEAISPLLDPNSSTSSGPLSDAAAKMVSADSLPDLPKPDGDAGPLPPKIEINPGSIPSDAPSGDTPPPTPKPAAAPGSAEEAEQNKARDAILKLLNASSPDSIIGLVHDSKRLASSIREYHKQKTPEAFAADGIVLDSSARVPESKARAFLFNARNAQRPQGFPISVEETPTGYKIDWEACVQCRDRHVQQFWKTPSAQPQSFYVILRRGHYFESDIPNAESMHCFRVDSPNPDEESHYAFLPKTAEIAKELDRRMEWDLRYFVTAEFAHVAGKRVDLKKIHRWTWRGARENQP